MEERKVEEGLRKVEEGLRKVGPLVQMVEG